MSLIKEPKDVDFTVESKPWSAKELADFRKLMQKLKSGKKPVAKTTRLLKIKDTSTHVNTQVAHLIWMPFCAPAK
jgi:hypothetical protein